MSWKRKLEKSWGRLGMRSEWENKKIGDIVDVRRGSSPRPIHKYLATNGVPWVKIADATSDNSRYIWRTSEYITNDGVEKSVKIEPETLIVSNSATPGLPKIIKITACVHDGWLVFSNYRGVLRDFLYYKFIDIRRVLINQANGSVFQNLKTDIIRNFDISLPNTNIQIKIVNILSNIDDKIELNTRINNNLLEQVLTLYRNRFIDTINNKRRIFRADKYFDISIGKTPPRKEPHWFSNNTQDITWVSISDMGTCGLYISSSSEQLIREAVERHNVKIVPDNTILLSFKLTVGRIAITNGEMTTNEAIAHFKTDKKEINEYLYCYLKCFNYQTMGSTSSIATAVNSKIIKGMPFVVPTDDELIDFHSVAAPIFAKIKANQTESKNLTAVRDTLLPKLMSGELDVSNIEI